MDETDIVIIDMSGLAIVIMLNKTTRKDNNISANERYAQMFHKKILVFLRI